MVESLRVLKVCRKTAVQARRIALQIIQTTIVCAPDRLRDLLRNMTRMKLIRTLAAWRPDLTGYRDVEEAYKIALKSLARRYLELHDEVAELDDMIEAIVKELAPELIARNSVGGSQYCSHDYQKILRNHGFKASMSGKGNCYDNAAVETFFKTIKAELIWRDTWDTRRQAEMAIFEYINGFYNPRRRHSALGWKSPVAFERKVA